VLRVILGETLGQALPASAAEVVLVAANIDDMNPQLAEPLLTALFAAGALDVWLDAHPDEEGPPAIEVSALCPRSAGVRRRGLLCQLHDHRAASPGHAANRARSRPGQGRDVPMARCV
jgi:hypothetical protein